MGVTVLPIASSSIRRRLTTLVVVVGGVTAAIVAATVFAVEVWTHRSSEQTRVAYQTERLARTLEPLMASGNLEVISAFVHRLIDSTDGRVAVVVYAADGTRLTGAWLDGVGELPRSTRDAVLGAMFDGRHVVSWAAIGPPSAPIGCLFVVDDPVPLSTHLPEHLISAVVVLASLALLGILLRVRVGREVIDPLAALVDTTSRIADQRDYVARAPVARQDEIGILASSFNRMLDVLQRRSEDAREREQRFQRLAAATFEGIMFSRDLRVVEVNEQAAAMLRYSPQELEGRSVLDFTAPAYHQSVERWISEGFVGAVETLAVRRDGTVFPVEARLNAPGIGGALTVCVFRDVSESRQAAMRLRWSEEKFSKAFVTSPVALLIFRLDDRVVLETNPAFENLTGCGGDAWTGQTVCELGLWRPVDRPFVESIFQPAAPVLRDQPIELVAAVGEPRSCRMSLDRIVIGDETCALITFVDVTEHRRDAERRAALEAQLQQAWKLEAVGRLAGGVAHDFNNMLTVILGHAELALSSPGLPTRASVGLQAIAHAGQQSAQLTRQLLAFARQQTVEPRVLDLNQAVAAMIPLLGRLAGEQISLVWRPGDDLPPVTIDPMQISQCLANLCVNARDAIRGVGQVTIETTDVTLPSTDPVYAAWIEAGRFVVLSVTDNGRGIPSELRERIFEPFFTTKDQGEGTGLGLATVFGIARQNGGAVLVESALGHGSTFRVLLPATTDELVDLPDVLPSEAGDLSGHGRIVLIVEDEAAILELGREILRKYGYVVLAAAMPSQAIELAETFEGPIDLLVSDLVMPQMNGRELADVLGTLRPGLPSLFISGYDSSMLGGQRGSRPDAPILRKPFTARDFAAAVHAAVETGTGAAAVEEDARGA